MVILDPNIQSSRARRLFSSDRNIWIACSQAVLDSPEGRGRASVLHSAGASFIPFPCEEGRISIPILLSRLHDQYHLASIFIESGLRFLPALLSQVHLLDAVVVTIAPKLVGSSGRAPAYDQLPKIQLKHFETLTLDEDVTFGSWIQTTRLLDQLHMSKSVRLANRLCSVHRVPLQEDATKPERLEEGLSGWVVVKRASTMKLPQPHDVNKEVKILRRLQRPQVRSVLSSRLLSDRVARSLLCSTIQ